MCAEGAAIANDASAVAGPAKEAPSPCPSPVATGAGSEVGGADGAAGTGAAGTGVTGEAMAAGLRAAGRAFAWA